MIPSVRIGEFVGNGGEGSGPGFTVSAITGLDGVEMRRDLVDRPAAHGEFEVPGFLTGRVVTVEGKCFAESPEQLGWFRRQLSGIFAGGGSGVVQFDWLGEQAWGVAQRAAKPEFDDSALPGRIADYFLSLRFPNPRLFGESRTFGPAASVTAHHYGNFPAAPVLTVSGVSASGYTVTGPGGRLFTVTRALVSGQPHTIDMATGYLRVGGAIVYGSVSRGDTWAVPPGVQTVMSVSGGSAVLAATVKDTYI